jgi:hypothetical protein
MKRILILLFALFAFQVSFPQVKCIYKTSRTGNQVIYHKKSIKLFSGQKIHLSTSITVGKLKNIQLIDTLKSEIDDFQNMSATIERHNAEKQLCIDLNQIYPGDGKTITVLLVKNSFRKRLSYKVKVYSEVKKRYVKVKVLPVMPGLSGITTWQYPVSSVILYKLRVSRE